MSVLFSIQRLGAVVQQRRIIRRLAQGFFVDYLAVAVIGKQLLELIFYPETD